MDKPNFMMTLTEAYGSYQARRLKAHAAARKAVSAVCEDCPHRLYATCLGPKRCSIAQIQALCEKMDERTIRERREDRRMNWLNYDELVALFATDRPGNCLCCAHCAVDTDGKTYYSAACAVGDGRRCGSVCDRFVHCQDGE